jgi:hypothetical protein
MGTHYHETSGFTTIVSSLFDKEQNSCRKQRPEDSESSDLELFAIAEKGL